jgi:hypothetical protein
LLLTLLAGLAALPACDYFSPKRPNPDMGEPVARVGSKFLYKNDLDALGFTPASPDDSVRMMSDYIDSWIRRQLMLSYALDNLPPEKLNIDREVNDYRESLIIYLYEREYLAQNLDTVVSTAQAREFYEENLDNFNLATDLVRLNWVKVPADAPRQDSLRRWIASTDPPEQVSLNRYISQYAVDYNLTDSLWLTVAQSATLSPFLAEQYDLSTPQVIDFVESNYHWYFHLKEFKIKESTAPFEYVLPEVERMILNRRKLRLKKEFNDNIYKDAAKRNTFETF